MLEAPVRVTPDDPADGLCPLRSAQVSCSAIDDHLLLFDARTERGYILNTTASAIWQMCDGAKTRADIHDEFAASVGLPSRDIRADVDQLITDLHQNRLLDLV
ncbi:MAG: hypothetical protein NVSMB2_21570 [Chloroflexota bacterium]